MKNVLLGSLGLKRFVLVGVLIASGLCVTMAQAMDHFEDNKTNPRAKISQAELQERCDLFQAMNMSLDLENVQLKKENADLLSKMQKLEEEIQTAYKLSAENENPQVNKQLVDAREENGKLNSLVQSLQNDAQKLNEEVASLKKASSNLKPKFCTNCGAYFPSERVFCISCGAFNKLSS